MNRDTTSAARRVLITGATGFLGSAAVTDFADAAVAAIGGPGPIAVRAASRRTPTPSFPADVEFIRHPDLGKSSIGSRCSTASTR